ncbi:hypothetical protein O181_100572 [Austropuccinia psidii MF-1]|uniref:Integrase catalytic domain-containing protein n=1 Tax=Austropuccinia psidii MF-1 TaxID=1389203 RepID=A0A9Q3PHN1_9BASI|nr:hypothetical protein [Austropuccinia psidii MF-1]
MPFGLTNAPASFQNLVNDIFADFLDIYVVVYLDVIIVFSSHEEEHVKHVASVLQRLRDNNMFAKASKCIFHASSVEYLGYVVSSDGLKMDSSKAEQILNWPQPKIIKALQSFLGFANFYCCFIKNYSKKITPLTSLLRKDSPFIYNKEALSWFQILKEAFTTAPILSSLNPFLETIVETDASDYALNSLLSLVNDSGKHPIAFYSCKLLPAELDYEIHDKELLGIVWALKQLKALLSMSSKFLTCRQAHWAEFLSEFHFTMLYRPGRLATLPDALSCEDNMYPEHGVDFISKNPPNFHQVIKQDGIQESRLFSIKVKIFSDLADKIQKELLLFKDRVVIPSNEEIQLNILQKHHDSPLAGHPGQEKTLSLIKRDFYWAGMSQFIKNYVSSWQQCSRNKNIHHKKLGSLKPLQITSGPWNYFSMDFVTQLPLSSTFDSILVVVDRFSKMEIFIPTDGTINALELAQIFIRNVFSKHGLPVSIVSDRRSLFVSSFWTNLFQKLKISRDLSTASHPETDGQTERVNHILEQSLWMYVSYHQDDLHTWFTLAEFAYNNAENSSTKQSPFFKIYARSPSFDSIHISQDSPAGKLSTKLKSVKQAVKEELESEIRRFRRYADRNRSIPPDFQPGDKVWIASKNIKTTRPTEKNSERWLGPFEFIKKIGSHAYHLKLPNNGILVEEKEEWEVAQVVDSKLKRGKLWYLV